MQVNTISSLPQPGLDTIFIVGSTYLSDSNQYSPLNIWNSTDKSRYCMYNPDNQSIACGKVSPCGRFYAYGMGNDWTFGMKSLAMEKNSS